MFSTFLGPHRAGKTLVRIAVLCCIGLSAACNSNTSQPVVGKTAGSGVAKPATSPPADPNALELVFPYGSEKKLWVEAVTADFQRAAPRTAGGKTIQVRTVPMGSGELITEIQEGRLRAHLASPASAAFVELGNAESRAKTGKPLLADTQNLVLSPVVIVMWKPMAEALGWGKKPLGWSDVLKMATSAEGWAAYKFPQWGKFKFGHTHPEYSNSGLISLIAEVYAGAGKLKGLTLDDVHKPEVADFLGKIEKSVVHYGSSTGFFGRRMFEDGPAYLSASVLYENMVIESYTGPQPPPLPVVAIYPKEGTFWSDHPVGIVQRDWVDAEHREAAEKYVKFLLGADSQRRAMEFGFRPADPSIALASPLDAAHGVDPQQPQTTLEVPSAAVMKAVIDLWKQKKKHSRVVLALDVSGSMKGVKLTAAKQGAMELIAMLGDEDVLSLVPFSGQPTWAAEGLSMAKGRQQARQVVEGLFADNGTALYEAIQTAHQRLSADPSPDRISAIVVLSDGADTANRLTLQDLLPQIRSGSETRDIRVFTIGYGQDAKEDVLGQISDATRAKYFKGTPENIREVFKEISTFF